MAVITLIVARDMRSVFTQRSRSVVATCTGAQHLGVVDPCFRRPELHGMAGFALTGGVDMTGALADGDRAVVTGRTVGRDARMAERGRFPGRGRVTVVAFRRGRQVECVFACCDDAIVTGTAGARCNVGVVEVCGTPGQIGVAAAAFGTGRKVIGRQTGSHGAVVT